MYVIATVICPNFHFSVSPHVPFLNLLFEQIAYSNAYLLAKFGLDTAENEPSRVCPIHGAESRPAGSRAQVGEQAADLAARAEGTEPFRDGRPDQPSEDPVHAAILRALGADLAGAVPPAGAAARLGLAKIARSSFFCKILQIFGGLVLGCIKTKFCKKICV